MIGIRRVDYSLRFLNGNAIANRLQAVASGAKVEMPVTDMFWGDRCGRLTDPFGHSWSMATHQEDVAPEEMRRRAQAVSGLNQFASHLDLKIESRRA
jgi:hypothetical protein